MKNSDVVLTLILCCAASAAIAGCPGTLDNPERFDNDGGGGGAPLAIGPALAADAAGVVDVGTAPPSVSSSCPDVVKEVLAATQGTARCASAGCHSTKDNAMGLDLESSDIRGRLNGKKSASGQGLLIDQARPDDSVLYTKLKSTPPFGGRMPTGTPLDDATIECVRKWMSVIP